MVPVEWWVVFATLVGPVLAVQTQKFIERAGGRKQRRQRIFTALMANRATRLSDDYIRALNLIELDFAPGRLGGTKDRKVIDAWRVLRGVLIEGAGDGADQAQVAAWNARIGDRTVDLLAAMSAALGYDFSSEELRRGGYYPIGRAELETAQIAIAQGLRLMLEGKLSLPMKLTEAPPPDPEAVALQKALNEKLAAAYGEDGALKVRMQD